MSGSLHRNEAGVDGGRARRGPGHSDRVTTGRARNDVEDERREAGGYAHRIHEGNRTLMR
jgi:hypothetical protein